MFKPLSIYIGLRYTRAKRRNHFISFIALMSMLGMALGVLVLITVLSVMNGFDEQIQQKVFSMVPHITVSSLDGQLQNVVTLEKKLNKLPGVTAIEAFVGGQGLLQSSGVDRPVYITGIDPSKFHHVIALRDKMIQGQLDDLKPGSFGIIVGEGLALRLGLTLGDKVILVTPQLNASPVGVLPRIKRMTVVGIFKVGGGFGYDNTMALMNLHDAQVLYQMKNTVTGLQIKTKNPYDAIPLGYKIETLIPDNMQVSDWTAQYGNFFHAVSMEKTMMFFILVLIIAIAAFNLVSTLVMVVNEKTSDIAILRTYGASAGMIMRAFVVQGLVIGFIGTLLGVLGGVLLSLHVTQIVDGLQQLFHTHFISSDVYFINYLPSKLQWIDVAKISSVALGLSLLATLYPAWRASRVQPAEVLRYE
ncbi:MAG: lipoprotein-releasing ABC transporter permease subunit [Gammaproteobacteria bacterium]